MNKATLSLALLGDSVFDNKAYTQGAADVAQQLRGNLPSGAKVTLCAVDGATTTTYGPQLDRIPNDVTDLYLSLGGNDALENADLLSMSCRSMGDALDIFRERIEGFAESYGWALDATLGRAPRTTVCTIYGADLPGVEGVRARTALGLFNDAILRQALQRGFDVLDLRAVCTEPEDFTMQIEPSAQGGRKIAEAIAASLDFVPKARRTSRLLAG